MVRDTNPTWRPARVLDNRTVATGSMWITLEAVDDLPASYDPGHVLGLGLKVDGGYMRHAYTVSRGESHTRRFEHLYRIIPHGRMTPRLAMLPAGEAVFFHGPFHTPIQREIHGEAERIVLMATGTGVGPLFGYAEKALSEGETRPMALYAGFREESDICLAGELDRLARRRPNFEWHYTVTQPSERWKGLRGRIIDSVPDQIGKHKLETHHFHLVGNGEMVHLVRKALYSAGLSPERVSIETYFNHHAEPPDEEVEKLASRFRAGAELSTLAAREH
jgi:NAD(P)H-flavin reductase